MNEAQKYSAGTLKNQAQNLQALFRIMNYEL